MEASLGITSEDDVMAAVAEDSVEAPVPAPDNFWRFERQLTSSVASIALNIVRYVVVV